MSYVFHQQDQSVQQYSGLQNVGKEKEADLRIHDRTRYAMTYKRWMSANFAHEKLETLGYHIAKARSLYLTLA